jgi:hypothetical protein
MTPIREILEKHKTYIRTRSENGVYHDVFVIKESEFEAIEKDIESLYIPHIYSPCYTPSESDFTVNISGDTEIISRL